jgi:dTDP-4-dehydrorhamnose reductase
MPPWLVTGSNGQLGADVMHVLHTYGDDALGCARSDLDISSASDVERVLEDAAPDVVVNCAAYTAVDAAETDEAVAMRVNGDGPQLLADWCVRRNRRLIHISTDYVFAGDADEPYDVDAPVDPKSAYGRSKAAGEQAVLAAGGDCHIVRTAWVYGANGPNFVKAMTRLARERDTVDVVDDQHGSPTWSLHLARALVALGVADVAPGIWHCTNSGDATWYVFARAIFAELGLDPARVQPTTSDAFVRPAPRPSYSVLSSRKWLDAGLPDLPHWRDALHEAFLAVGEEFG